MFNLLRMDLRRLFQNRSFYIILVVTAVLLIMVTVMAHAIADPEMMDEMEAQGAEITEADRMMSDYIQNMSQLDFMHETLGSGFLLVMTGIGMTLLTAIFPADLSKISVASNLAAGIMSFQNLLWQAFIVESLPFYPSW